MWSSRLFWKLLLAYGALFAILILAALFFLASNQRATLAEQIDKRLRNDAVFLRSQVSERLAQKQYSGLQPMIATLGRQTQTRLTIVARDGSVLADSHEDPDRMGDHNNRPEINQAAHEGVGRSVRYSATLGRQLHYLALPVMSSGELHGYVRVAIDAETVNSNLGELNQILIFLMVAIVVLVSALSYGVAGYFSRHLNLVHQSAAAVAEGDYSRRVLVTSKDELGKLAASFNTMQEHLNRRFRQLQEHSDRMSTVLSGMVEGVLAVDPQLRVLLANQASIELLDITAKEVVGRPLMEVTRNRDVQQTVQDALTGGVSGSREIATVKAPRRILRLLATRMHGEPCPGVVVVLHDVTELRRLESLRRDFVANVSHELKTPLAAIKAYAETLRLGAIHDAENNVRFVERIEDQATRLNQLIVDLLHIARVESGKETFDFAYVSIAATAEACVSNYAETAHKSGVKLEVQPSIEDLHAWADQDGMRTIFDNLVGNAIRYTPEGGRVTIGWRHESEFAVIEVEDTGIGIAPEDQQRIFERFYRVDRARSREQGGTGLGLAIVKHLVQAFGGEVSLRSALGEGSTFSIRIPLAANRDRSL